MTSGVLVRRANIYEQSALRRLALLNRLVDIPRSEDIKKTHIFLLSL